MEENTYYIVSLGCAKNTVDSSSMSQLLDKSGYRLVDKPERAAVVIVNTCGFIGPAREESFETLRGLAESKRDGQLLVAAGCLTQRYGREVVEHVPGIDGVLGTRRWMDVVDVVRAARHRDGGQPSYNLPDVPDVGRDDAGTRRVSMQGASAYLKIADGCRRPCAFCAIPLIKGPAVSRPPESILNEAKALSRLGVKEIVLIAQDTTDYGHDIGMTDGLAKLLDSLCDAAPNVDWIRLMYAYPGYVTDRLIDVMASREQVVPYLDMPLQHAHPDTLRRMRRPANIDWVHRTLEKMRRSIPTLALRSTFIVGYPGETDSEYDSLIDFVRDVRFDRVGVFEFSFEEGTASAELGDPVPQEIKEQRREKLMRLQQSISLGLNQEFIGQTLDVLVEGSDDGIAIGRSYRDAPEVDGLVVVDSETAVGSLKPVVITGAMTYDLSGTLSGVSFS